MKTTKFIKIAIAENQKLYSSALYFYFRHDDEFKLMFTSNNYSELINNISGQSIDVLLINLNICGHNVKGLIKKIRSIDKGVKIIVLSSSDDKDTILNSLSQGADCFIPVECSIDELQVAIRSVNNLGHYFTEKVSSVLHKKYVENYNLNPVFSRTGILFTQPEIDIIRLTCNEMTSKLIAKELNLSERTIEAYRKKIFTKIGCKNIAGMTIFAVKNEIIAF